MEGSADAIIKLQSLVFEAIENNSCGDYHTAMMKFEDAKDTCTNLIKSEMYHGINLETLHNLLQKCENHAAQIHQYIESSDEIKLSESDYLSNSSIYRESDLGDTMSLFPSLKSTSRGDRINEDYPTDNYWGGYMWDKVEALFGIIRNHPQSEQIFQHFQTEKMPVTPREEITMDSSFFLIPSETSGLRVSLNDPVKRTLDPEERIKELEARNALMQNQLEQMKRLQMNQPKGVTNLMNENTKLKKSIIDFSNHIQKHQNSFRSVNQGISQGGDSVVIGTKEMETQIRELLLKVASLEKENLRKDKEIKELTDYKEKWLNLKKEASARKIKQGSNMSGDNSSISISDSTRG